MDQQIYVTFAPNDCPKQFHIVKKIHYQQSQKGKDSAFKDFILDCVHEITTAKKEDPTEDKSPASTQTGLTKPPRKRLLMTDLADSLEGGQTIKLFSYSTK
jgi:hypothetical protein